MIKYKDVCELCSAGHVGSELWRTPLEGKSDFTVLVSAMLTTSPGWIPSWRRRSATFHVKVSSCCRVKLGPPFVTSTAELSGDPRNTSARVWGFSPIVPCLA